MTQGSSTENVDYIKSRCACEKCQDICTLLLIVTAEVDRYNFKVEQIDNSFN